MIFPVSGFYAADVVPFAVHFNNSIGFTRFIEWAFSDGLSVRINEKSAECEKKLIHIPTVHLDLPEEEKAQYMLETNYSDKELIFTEERVSQYTSYLYEISTEGNEKYNKSAFEEYENLKNNKNKYSEQEFIEKIYYLFVKYYHKKVQSYFVGAKAPLLCDYYFVNYLAANPYNGIFCY